ncbi:MAG: hypothetical protein AABZ84_04370, partial [Pseudomonadota bacterium]
MFGGTPVASAGAGVMVGETGSSQIYFEESLSGGRVGNPFFGNGELQPVMTGDTEGLARLRDARFRRPVAVAAKDHWVYVVDADQQQVILYDRISGTQEV